MNALVAGSEAPAAALVAALAEREIEAERYDAPDSGERAVATLAEALVALEQRLESGNLALAVAVGSGDAPTALAVTAAKLGVPLAAWAGEDGAGGELDQAELRIIATLAGCDVGSAPVAEAALKIASWANLNLRA